jgi:hypothetical protein
VLEKKPGTMGFSNIEKNIKFKTTYVRGSRLLGFGL